MPELPRGWGQRKSEFATLSWIRDNDADSMVLATRLLRREQFCYIECLEVSEEKANKRVAKATFRAAAAQLTSTDDLAANLLKCKELAAEAADRGVQLLSLPECFAFLGRHERDKFAVAEVLDPAKPGPILEALQGIARNHSMWVTAGGLPERLDEEAELPAAELTRAYNTHVLLDTEGAIVAAYRKIHLFDVDIPGGAVLRESDSTAAGNHVVVVDSPWAWLGLSICYDLRFAELYRRMTLDQGAQVLLIPAAFTAHTGAAHWHILMQARAIENQCYVIAAAQTGRHNDKRESFGHSLIVDPWGTVVAEVESGDGLAVADIDAGSLAEKRAQMPCLTHSVLRRSTEGGTND